MPDFIIKAEVHSDDYDQEVDFDAAAWFEQASDKEITDLAECGWGGDYPADYVAKWFEDTNPDIAEVFEHCRHTHEMGFECHVEAEDVYEWLEANRPGLVAAVRETDPDEMED